MFRRPAVYHSYKPSGPAGFRIKDYLPKRCFNLFQAPHFADIRSPESSPLSSPVRGARDSDDDDAPPTIRLADLFAGGVDESPRRPIPASRRRKAQPNAGPAEDALPKPQPRRKGPKHLSFTNIAQRSRDLPPHHRSQQLKEKRDALHGRKLEAHERRAAQARDQLRRLVREAEALMKPEHMTREDHIFLKQLGKLEFEQELSHGLERCREQMARTAGEAEQRRKVHEARDREAEKLWAEKTGEEALEEQRRKVEEFVQKDEDELVAEAILADKQRQRAHEAAERKIREEQERRFRAELVRKGKEEEERRRRKEEERRLREERQNQEREEWMRQLQEAIERARRMEMERRRREEEERKRTEEASRQRREAREQFLREERERLAREAEERQARARAEQARCAAEEEQIHQYFIVYEGKWNELRTSNSLPPIDVREMPWPVFSVISSADQITYQDVRTFLFHPQRPGVEGKTVRDKVKAEVLRFHPDKFNTRIVPKIVLSQQAVAQEIAGAVARILTTIMTEEVE